VVPDLGAPIINNGWDCTPAHLSGTFEWRMGIGSIRFHAK
jgi:hypothetical protein